MKRKNVKVGGIYVMKNSDSLLRVESELLEDDKIECSYARDRQGPDGHTYPIFLRRPRISDLRTGDVFEWDGDQFMYTKRVNRTHYADALNAELRQPFEWNAKIKLISLASEKVEPKALTGNEGIGEHYDRHGNCDNPARGF